MNNQNPNSNVLSKQLNALALQENTQAQSKLDGLLLGCFTVQKLYGREPDSLDALNQMFHAVLGKYPSTKVLQAFEIWIERSQEFPTPADIVELIKRNGKPPLSEGMYVTISRKDPEARTRVEWDYMQEFEQERLRGSDYRDAQPDTSTLQENVRLRKELSSLKSENARLSELLHDARVSKGIERPKPSMQEKIDRTVSAMKQGGAPQADIDSFLVGFGLPT